MRVDWAIPCRYAEVQPGGGATIVGAGADLLSVGELPAPVPVPVLFAVRYVGAPDELDGDSEHTLAVRVFDPAGEQIDEQVERVSPLIEQVIPGYVAELIVPTRVVIDAADFGTYSAEFEIDGDRRRVPVHIVEAPEEPG